MEFCCGQLVRVIDGKGVTDESSLNLSNLRIITGYEEESGLYLSKRATKKGEIDKRTESVVLKTPIEALEPVEKSILSPFNKPIMVGKRRFLSSITKNERLESRLKIIMEMLEEEIKKNDNKSRDLFDYYSGQKKGYESSLSLFKSAFEEYKGEQ